MSAWDVVLPHRLLVNKSLHKSSEELRSRIDDYKLHYELEIERCGAEIEQAKADKDKDFDKVTLSLIDELAKDADLFEKVRISLLEYVDLFLHRQCLYKTREYKNLEKQALSEYISFLSERMGLIGKEIEILETRKDKLIVQANVDDIIELIVMTGNNLIVDENANAKSLLDKVSELRDSYGFDDKITKDSLNRLRVILQERVEFISIIQYISWTIQQKIQMSRHLSGERRRIINDMDNKVNEVQEVSKNIDGLSHTLDEQARRVRDYWAIPITKINVKTNFMYMEKQELHDSVENETLKLNRLHEELKETSEKIERMKGQPSSDSGTWNRLWDEKSSYKEEIASSKRKRKMLYEQIPQINSDIETLKSERQQWYERRDMLYSLCKRNNVDLIYDKKPPESDECRIINNRLAELYRIEETENKLANERFLIKSTQIQQQKKEKEAEFKVKIDRAKNSQAEKHEIFHRASINLLNSKKRDTRFILTKLFSKSEEVNRAEQAQQKAELHKKNADYLLSRLNIELAEVINDFDKQLAACRPIPYRPFASEVEERKKLENRKAELLEQQSKKQSKRGEKNESTN